MNEVLVIGVPVPPDPLGAGAGVDVVSVISLPWRRPVTRLRAFASDPAHSEKLLTMRVSAGDPPPPRVVTGVEVVVFAVVVVVVVVTILLRAVL